MKKLALLLSLLALGAVGLTACGGGDDDQTAAASEADPARKSCHVPRYRLAVNQGDISCRGARRVILDLANDRLPGSWSCTGPEANVVCTKEPGASSRNVITAYFASGAPAAAVEDDPENENRLSNEERIEQMGNDWAALFAKADPATSGYYEGQPAWEREDCTGVGGHRIRPCTPLSAEFRESFADATVERIVVEGRHATAEFSNGESVEFVKGMFGTPGGSWSITVHTVMNFER